MSFQFIQGDAAKLPLEDRSADLVLGSPPYLGARLYLEDGKNLGIARGCQAWIDWMLGVTAEACRVSRGLVIWVCAGSTKKHCYQPGPEGLLYEWWKRGGQCWRPAYWHRFGIPGSGGKQWLRADVEYALCFKGERGRIPWAENTACGHPPKYPSGGAMSNRRTDGSRKSKEAGGASGYSKPEMANPGNLVYTGATGGGHLGHPMAHENEAPYPESLVEFFVKSFCPHGGTVVDPFSGSGTTVSVAHRLGRHGMGIDLRPSQVNLGRRRAESPVAPKVKPEDKEFDPHQMPLFAEAA